MNTSLKRIAGIGIALVIGLVGYHAFAASNIIDTPIALFSTSLSSAITSNANTMTLASGITGDRTNLASSTYSFIIDQGQSDQEFVRADCTNTTCINMVRGLSMVDGQTAILSLAQPHRRGQSVSITDAPLLLVITNMLNGVNGFPNALSYATTATTTNGFNLVDKTYVDNIAFSGAGVINATTGARGIVQLATGLQQASSTSIGSSGASLVLTAANATSTYNVATAPLKVVVTNNQGTIDPNFINLSAFSGAQLSFLNAGDGSDGNVIIASNSTTTLSRDMYYNNLTVNGAIVTGNWRIFVNGTISGAGSIVQNGNAGVTGGAAGSSPTTGGLGGATIRGYFTTLAGSNGGNGGVTSAGGAGVSGTNLTSSLATTTTAAIGGVGSAATGDAGGQPGTLGIATSSVSAFGKIAAATYMGLDQNNLYTGPTNSTGGGGGGSLNSTAGGGGGGAASAGGFVYIIARTCSGSFALQAFGASGGIGGAGSALNQGNGGGGGGGNGGIVALVCGVSTYSGLVNVSGGLGGIAGNGGTNIAAAGSNGISGAYYIVPFYNLTR